MRIDLVLGGVAPVTTGLGQVAGAYSGLARVMGRVSASAAALKFPSPVDTDTRRVLDYARAWQEVAKAQQGVSSSAPKVAGPLKTASSVAANAPVTSVAHAKTAPNVSASAAPSVAASVPAARFLKGPQQRLAEIAAQRQALPTVTDPKQRAQIEQDLARAEFLAQRSIKLHERRMVNPAESLNRPGLLELFGSLNDLLRSIASGNAVGAVRELAQGIKLVSDVGGLNISQKLSRTALGGIGAGLPGTGTSGGGASGFNPNARGVFNLSQIQAGHAQLAKGAATSPGSLSQFVMPGSVGAKIGNSRVMSGAVNLFGGVGNALGKAVPAIGKVAASAGPLGAAFVGLAAVTGGLVLVVGAVALGIHLFSEGLKHAIADLVSFRGALTQSGGSPGSVAQLTAFGIAPDQVAGMGQAFRDRTAAGGGDVYGQIGRARLGLNPTMGGPMGNPDTAADLVQAIEGLRKISDRGERLRVARMTGTEGLLGAAGTSTGVFREMRQDAGVSASIRGDKQTGQAAADLQANAGRLFSNLGAMVTAWMKPFTAPLSAFVGNLATLARFGAQHLERVSRIPLAIGRVAGSMGKALGSLMSIFGKLGGNSAMLNLMDRVTTFIANGLDTLANAILKFADSIPIMVGNIAKGLHGVGELIANLPGGGAAGSALMAVADKVTRDMNELVNNSAMREHSDAMKKHTDALRAGTFGGGPRARAALGPSALTGETRARAVETHAIALGYWTL